MDREEAALVQRAQGGSEDALNGLIERYYQTIYAYFYKNTGQYHQSMDLTQEVFIKAAAGIGRYRPLASFRSWLFAIASNHLKNYYRLLSRHPNGEALWEELSIGSSAKGIEQRNDISNALARLPPAQKETILLRFYHDFSIKEISKITGVPATTVKARIRYGLEKLKRELEGYNEKGDL